MMKSTVALFLACALLLQLSRVQGLHLEESVERQQPSLKGSARRKTSSVARRRTDGKSGKGEGGKGKGGKGKGGKGKGQTSATDESGKGKGSKKSKKPRFAEEPAQVIDDLVESGRLSEDEPALDDITGRDDPAESDGLSEDEQALDDITGRDDPVEPGPFSEDEPITGRVDDTTRRVQVKRSEDFGKCMAYNALLDSPVRIINCTETGVMDTWQVILVTGDLFRLRHAQSQLCLPENPESPELSFDCFEQSGPNVAIADSVNGLVDCDSPYAAVLGFTDSANSMYIYNTICGTAGDATNIVLMTYTKVIGGNPLVLWGEKNLLGMDEMVELHDLSGNWILVDV